MQTKTNILVIFNKGRKKEKECITSVKEQYLKVFGTQIQNNKADLFYSMEMSSLELFKTI
jgi:uncharacterized protein Veg